MSFIRLTRVGHEGDEPILVPTDKIESFTQGTAGYVMLTMTSGRGCPIKESLTEVEGILVH